MPILAFASLTIALTGLCALALSLGLTPIVGKLARRLRLVDSPNARAVHREPTPRIGGVAIVAASLGALGIVLATAHGQQPLTGQLTLQDLILASLAIFAVGLLDDLVGLSSKIKLVALVAVSTVLWMRGARIDALYFGEDLTLHLGVFSWLATVLFIVSITVAINFIDGMDGLAAGISVMALFSTAVIAAVRGQPELVVLCMAIAGSLLGFLVYNFNPASIFMGDSGSMFLGFTLGSCGAILASSTQSARSTAGFLLALGIPLLDLMVTMVRRKVLQRRSIFAAERGHIHHQLLDRGMSHRRVVLHLYGITAVLTTLGVIAMVARTMLPAAFLGAGAILLVWLFYRAGSIAPMKLVSAYRRNRCLARDDKMHRESFEQMQLRFRQVDTFDRWWEELCRAAGMLNIISMVLTLEQRDGSKHDLRWEAVEGQLNGKLRGLPPVQAVIPIRHRRIGPPLEARVRLAVNESLEDVGRRMMLFSRLTEEFSLATLPQYPMAVQSGDGSDKAAKDAPSTQPRKAVYLQLPDRSTVSPSHLLEGPVQRTVDLTVGDQLPQGGDSIAERESTMSTSKYRIAVVHDFLYTYAGAERVLEQILQLYPQADLFSLFDFLPAKDRGFIGGRKVKSSFIQWLPLARTKHRSYLPFMPLAIEQMDVSKYDLVISSSYVAAKGVITRPDQLHICYCHSPVRFAWDLQQQYLEQSGLTRGVKSFIARAILHYIRNWDARSANGVDLFVTNSDFVARRIEKVYRRSATTIYPPVDTKSYSLHEEKDDFYLTASRMVPYKKIDLIIEAFNRMPNRRLVIIGDGPDAAKLKARAGSNIRFLGYQPFETLRHYMQRARAFVFAAEEDFGIVPNEAQACGTPVIAYGRGGVTESVLDGVTGVFFNEQEPESLVAAVQRFESLPPLDPLAIRLNAERFAIGRFRLEFARFVETEMLKFRNKLSQPSNEEFPKPYTADIPPAHTPTQVAVRVETNGNGSNGNASSGNGNGNGSNGNGNGKRSFQS